MSKSERRNVLTIKFMTAKVILMQNVFHFCILFVFKQQIHEFLSWKIYRNNKSFPYSKYFLCSCHAYTQAYSIPLCTVVYQKWKLYFSKLTISFIKKQNQMEKKLIYYFKDAISLKNVKHNSV